MTVDVRQLTQLANSLRINMARAEPEMRAIVARGALHVKADWRANAAATSGRHARAYPYSVNFDILPIPGGASAEIGPDKGKKQGKLGNLLEYGSVNNQPHNDGGRALIAEHPRFEAQVIALTQRLGRL